MGFARLEKGFLRFGRQLRKSCFFTGLVLRYYLKVLPRVEGVLRGFLGKEVKGLEYCLVAFCSTCFSLRIVCSGKGPGFAKPRFASPAGCARNFLARS